MIKAVIFDVGSVLQLYKKPVVVNGKDYSGVFEYIVDKLDIGLDAWFDAIDTAYADSIEGKISERKAVHTIARNLNKKPGELGRLLVNAYRKMFVKNKELYKAAYELKKKGYIIGILSDQWYLSKRALMSPKDVKLFNPVIISCDVGIRKPDVRIYRLLMSKLRKMKKGLKISEVLFIDNRDYNLEPAVKMGMKVILFKNNKQCLREMGGLGVDVKLAIS